MTVTQLRASNEEGFDLIDTVHLKRRVTDRAEEFIRELFGSSAHPAGAGRWRVGSKGSLAISIQDDGLVFFSHEDGTGGDAIVLWQRERGGSIGEALQACAAFVGIGSSTTQSPACHTRLPTATATTLTDALPYVVSLRQIEAAGKMARRLCEDADLRQRIATRRGWNPETLRALTLEPSLGWHEDHEGGKFAFLYETGVKLRWRNNHERIIRWHFGKPWLWRGGLLTLSARSRVIITEGETDAIRLVDAGAEDDGNTLVVALPSATGFAPNWGRLFQGKDVILALDNDGAGQRATARLTTLLRPAARTVCVLNWKEVLGDAA